MELIMEGSQFVAVSSFAEKDIVKAAGFRWDGVNRRWWTADVATASKLAEFATDSLRAELESIKSQREAALAASRATDADVSLPVPEGLSYLPYQKAGIAFALERQNLMIADEMGLGKTIQAIGVINSDPSIRSVLVICPASLKLNWQKELRRWLVAPMSIAIANGTFPADSQIVISNYDILKKHHDAIRSRSWDLLIVDECHYLKSPDALRTKHVLGYSHKGKDSIAPIAARRRCFLSGTPMVNRPVELWPLVSSLDPDGLGKNFFAFGKRYCSGFQGRFGWDFTGASHLDELQERLRMFTVRRKKADVLTELPPKRRQVVELPAAGDSLRAVQAEQAAWRSHEDELDKLRAAVEVSKASDNPADYEAAVKNLREAAKVAFEDISRIRHETAVAKVPQVIEHLTELFEETEKVVLFVHHHDVAAAVLAAFPGAAVLTGETKMVDRQAAVERFQTDPSCRLFVGSIGAAGVGHTLTAASTVVFAELSWVPGEVTQAEDRCILEGQPVLTPFGWVPIEKIAVGDKVITRTGSIGYVADAWSKGCTKLVSEMVVEGWLHPIKTTIDHRFLLSSGEWVEAGNIKPGDRIAMPAPDFDMPDLPHVDFDSDCIVGSHFIGHWGAQSNGRLLSAPSMVDLSDDALFSFGYFVGDGFASTVENKGRFISFAGHRDKKKAAIEVCKRWAESHGMTASIYDDGKDNGIEMRCFSAEWAFWFQKQFGKGAHGKKLPTWITHLSRRQSQVMLDGLIASDGYRRNNRVEYSTVSYDLASQVALLMLRAGHRACVTRAVQAQVFVVAYSESQTNLSALVRSITFRHPQKVNGGRENVYDLTIKGDGEESNFVIGLSVVHNCHRIGQVDSVLVQHLVLEGSLDARMAEILVEKQNVIDAALDKTHADKVEAAKARAALDASVPAVPGEKASTASVSREQVEKEAASLTPEQVAAIHHGLRILAGVCDGASSYDGAGFSKIDAHIGHSLADAPVLSARQASLGLRLVTKYKRQLPASLLETARGGV